MTEYKHKEAFALMHYVCVSCEHHEIIWNSRDGVTPFCMTCPSCGEPGGLAHKWFNLDRCAPGHKPYRGQRMWVNMTLEKARAIAVARVSRGAPERQGDTGFIEQLTQNFYTEFGAGTSPTLAIFGYTENPPTEGD